MRPKRPKEGFEATAEMVFPKRAGGHYYGEKSRGHKDPRARQWACSSFEALSQEANK
jgi:hypothetical protein